jgi:predicted nucleotidyltransferase
MVEINTQPAREELLHRYKEALHSFVARVQQDRHVIAAILYGSLAYNDVWEKSDIDILLIGKEENVDLTRFWRGPKQGLTKMDEA